MYLNIDFEIKDVARVALKHPDTKEGMATFLLAGPDHEATRNLRRENADRVQKPDYKYDVEAEENRLLLARTIGWEGIKNMDTGEDVPFDANMLPDLYKRFWLRKQVIEALNDDGFFYRE